MNISLTEEDLSQMPPALRTSLVNWQMTKMSATGQKHVSQHRSKPKETINQLSLLPEPENRVFEQETNHTHVTLTKLYDAGITKPGMPIRVKLKRDIAKKRGRSYFNSLEISPRGTVLLEGQEFDKPSPLATKINCSPARGWEYVEIKVNGQWVRLEQLRQTWRQTSTY